jgi:Kef-type K+ transport system membrane component KefB
VYTVIYIFVLISHLKLQKDVGGKTWLIVINLIILIAVFVALMLYQWNTQKSAFIASILTFSAALIIEFIFRKFKNRKMKHHKIKTVEEVES